MPLRTVSASLHEQGRGTVPPFDRRVTAPTNRASATRVETETETETAIRPGPAGDG